MYRQTDGQTDGWKIPFYALKSQNTWSNLQSFAKKLWIVDLQMTSQTFISYRMLFLIWMFEWRSLAFCTSKNRKEKKIDRKKFTRSRGISNLESKPLFYKQHLFEYCLSLVFCSTMCIKQTLATEYSNTYPFFVVLYSLPSIHSSSFLLILPPCLSSSSFLLVPLPIIPLITALIAAWIWAPPRCLS